MRKLVWFLAFVAAALWSLFIWAGYALLGWANEVFAGAPGELGLPPEVAFWATWAGTLFEQVGQGAAIVVWVLGLGLIFALAAIVGLFFGRRRRPAERFVTREQQVFRPDLPQSAPRVQPRPSLQPEPPRAPSINWGRSADRR